MAKPLPRSANFELAFSPGSDLVSSVRRFITDFYDRVFADPDLSSRLGMASHELLENAVKYSTDQNSRIAIQISEGKDQRSLIIKTWNRTTPEHLRTVQSILKRINEASSPKAFYRELILSTADDDTGESAGLGLARIVGEGDMTLTCDVQGDTIYFIAEASLGEAYS
jgi:two-component sensor histidine kinase